MFKNQMKCVLVFMPILAGCAGPMRESGPSTVAANCAVSSTTCSLQISRATGTDNFTMSIDPVYLPSDGSQNVDVCWLLPAGHTFLVAPATGHDGPQLPPASPYTNNYVTNSLCAQSYTNDVGYHYTIVHGVSFDTHYHIIFRGPGPVSGPSRIGKWDCDPTIATFSGLIKTLKAGTVTSPPPMTCTFTPS